jgi:hypothetical protein
VGSVVVVPRSRRAAAVMTQAIGDSTGAGTGVAGSVVSVGVSPTTSAIVDASVGSVEVTLSGWVWVAGSVASVAACPESVAGAVGSAVVSTSVVVRSTVVVGIGDTVSVPVDEGIGEAVDAPEVSLLVVVAAAVSAVSLTTGAGWVAVAAVAAVGAVGTAVLAVEVVSAVLVATGAVVVAVGLVLVDPGDVPDVPVVPGVVVMDPVVPVVDPMSVVELEELVESVDVPAGLDDWPDESPESFGAADATPFATDKPTPSTTANPPTRPI